MVATTNACYKIVSNKVSSIDRDRLDLDLNNEELLVALSSMNNGKSPRIDGLICGFYMVFWDTIKNDFSQMNL